MYELIRGSRYIETPKAIAGKHVIINPQNTDEMCFKLAVLVALHPVKEHSYRVSKYEQYKDELNLKEFHFQ